MLSNSTLWGKKLHHFIFAITLSKLRFTVKKLLAHNYILQ